MYNSVQDKYEGLYPPNTTAADCVPVPPAFLTVLVLGADMHKVRTDKIKKLDNDIILPQNVINKYKHLNNILFD